MGMDVDLDAVHLRELDMTPGEILMSESQERMLAIVTPEDLEEVLALAEKWEIAASAIGHVNPSKQLRVFHHGELVAEVPAASLSDDAPLYRRPAARPEDLDRIWEVDEPLPAGVDLGDTLLRLLADPALGDPSWIFEQYDHQLFLNTVIEPGNDGSLLRIKGTSKGLAVSTDGNALLCHLDPRRGAARLVYEAGLNVAVTGARPYAVVDNLNFGNPEKPAVMWQFLETVEGMAEACEALGVPVVGGNVSFYNETGGEDIYPSPVVGMLGFCDPMPERPPRLDQAEPGMEVWLIGPEDHDDFAASAYTRVVLGHRQGRPSAPDPAMAVAVIEAAATLAHTAPVLHDVSSGGVAVALAEICIKSGVGVALDNADWRCLLSESPHRFLAVVPAGNPPQVGDVPARRIGTMGGDTIDFDRHGEVTVARAAAVWRNALRGRLG